MVESTSVRLGEGTISSTKVHPGALYTAVSVVSKHFLLALADTLYDQCVCLFSLTALPTIIDLSIPTVHTEGERVELVCSFTGNPAPQIRWEKDGSLFLHGGSRRTINTSGRSLLEINNLALSDAGVYTCSVSNDAGNATRSVRLEVRGEGVSWK